MHKINAMNPDKKVFIPSYTNLLILKNKIIVYDVFSIFHMTMLEIKTKVKKYTMYGSTNSFGKQSKLFYCDRDQLSAVTKSAN